MMKKIKYILELIIILLAFNSCSDFLKPKSQSEFMPETADQLNTMLLGEGYPAPESSIYLMKLIGVLDDDLTCRPYFPPDAGYAPYSDKVVNGLFSVYTWQPDFSIVMNDNTLPYFDMYSSYYEKLMASNAVLDYVDKVSGTTDEKLNVKAQAYALRAYFYFQFVNIYGAPYNYNKQALGVPLKLTSSIEERAFTRNTVEEVYSQILSDLKNAENAYDSLPVSMQFRKNYRTSLPMVLLLSSRVNLYMENWQKAADYSAKLMADWPQFTFINLNNLPAPGTTELLYNFITYTNPENIWVFGGAEDMSTAMGYRLSAGGNDSKRPALFQASPDLIGSFETGDLRKSNYIVPEFINKTQYRAFGKYSISKYTNSAYGGYTYFGQAFRISEAYLNYAEALAHLNKNGDGTAAQKAIDALNTLRQARFTPATYTALNYTDADALIETVKTERRKELCYEGHRWFDLRRYGMPQIKHTWIASTTSETYTLTEKDPAYTLPIPQTIMEQNPSLIQNPLAPKREN